MNKYKADLSERLIENGHPLLAALIEDCRIFVGFGGSNWLTVHVFAPDEYRRAQISSPSVWPNVHRALVQDFGVDLTLNVELAQ